MINLYDKHLTFKHHVDVISRKISKSVGILFKLSKYLPLEILKTLYYSSIHFYYTELKFWHGTYVNITNKIFILQKRPAGPSIICLSILTQPNTLKIAKMLKLTYLYKSQISKHMLKCLNLNDNILPKHSDIHNYPTRNNNKFITPKCNMRKSEMSKNFKSIKVRNKRPADIRTSDSLNVFMDNLRKYFLSQYWVHH